MFEKLDIQTFSDSQRRPPIPSQSAPRLCHFSFSTNGAATVAYYTPDPPYSHLTHLDLKTFATFNDVLEVLPSSQKLVECNLDIELDRSVLS
jgi:hypothetical protein